MQLLREQGNENLLEEIQEQYLHATDPEAANLVKQIYALFSPEELARKIAEISRPADLAWDGEIQIIYQTLEGLHQSIPHHTGDWYFSGDYPTPGGLNVLRTSYLNWCAGSEARAY